MKKTKNKLISLLLAFTMVAVLLPTLFATPAFAAYTTRCGITADWNAWTSNNSLPSGGCYYLNTNVTMNSKVVRLTSDLYLDLNGYTITFTGSNSNAAFIVEGNYRWFDLYDSVGGGKIVESSSANNYHRAVWVDGTGARFNMHGGTIDGFRSGYDGAGVYIKNGSMTMYGGTIQNCYAYADIGTNNGGGGGVYVSSGATFNMDGGTIYKNTGRSYGGGVFCYGTFNMTGGYIYSNNAWEHGGGVNINSCTFTMSGGYIYNNTAGKLGGGVSSYQATFNMSGGNIYSNNCSGGSGGGVAMTGGTFTMSNASIYSCTAFDCGGGLYIYNSGTANINSGSIIRECTSGYSGGGIAVDDNISKLYVNGGYIGRNYSTRYESSSSGVYNEGSYVSYTNARVCTADTFYWSCTPNASSKITFNQNNGSGGTSSISSQSWKSALPNITPPTRAGYTFNGYTNSNIELYYYPNGTPVSRTYDGTNWDYTGNQTLYAQWTANKYTVTLDSQGGTGGTASVTATYASNMPTATMPTRSGYTFNGYFDATSGGTQYYKADGTSARAWDKAENTTLYAQWTANTNTVTLDNQSATTEGSTSVTATYDASMPAATMPTKTGYTFGGYFDAQTDGRQYYNADGTSAKNWDKAEDTTLYAQWTENTATLTYNANGHGTAPEAVTMKYTAATNAAAALSEKGFVFNGWNTAQDGTGTAYAAGAQVKEANADPADTTLYAQWLTITDWHLITETCDSNEGKGGSMGHQDKRGETGVGRVIIPLTQDQLNSIGDTLVIVGGDYGIEATVTIDCAYTYFYNDNQKIEAGKDDLEGIAAFVIIENDGNNGSISGYGYYRLYSDIVDDANHFLFDAMFNNPVNN